MPLKVPNSKMTEIFVARQNIEMQETIKRLEKENKVLLSELRKIVDIANTALGRHEE